MSRRPAPALSRVCPKCRTVGPARLAPGEVCATCRAQTAWSELDAAGPLVIDHDAIADAEKRRAGEAAGEPLWRRALVWLPPAIVVAISAFAGWLAVDLLSPRSIGPLDALLDDLHASARDTTLAGGAAVVVGIAAMIRLRRHRHFRRIAVVAVHGLALVVAGAALVLGLLHWLGSGEFAWRHRSMPAREALGLPAQVRRILDATVVVLAPDADGDARFVSLGTGAVISRDDGRAWIVTCSHVAMPYAAVGAFRHARDAQPVWVQLSDGRGALAHVRWTAPPPLDVVLLEMPIDHPPEPVPIAPDASTLQNGDAVTFGPNPYRRGWLVLHGKLLRRETHSTPAGVYDLLFTDLPVQFGDSGSGLYDERGRLVGINAWTRLGDGPAQGISLPSEAMRALVDAIAANKLDALEKLDRKE